MKYNINASGKGKLSADQKRSALWSKCAAKFGKVAKCAAGAKSLRTIADRPCRSCSKAQNIQLNTTCDKNKNVSSYEEAKKIIIAIFCELCVNNLL